MNKTHKINALNIIKYADPKKTCINDNLDDILELKNTKPLKNKVFINSLREPHNQDKPMKNPGGGAPKGRIPWNKGLTKADPRVKANHEKSVATKKANGFYASHKPPPPNFGDNNWSRSPEGRRFLSEKAKKRWAQLKKKNPSAPNFL